MSALAAPADTERTKDRTTIKKLRQERDGLIAQVRNLEQFNSQLSKQIDTLVHLPALGISKEHWQPIETAPRDANIIAKFWHGFRYYVIEAKPGYGDSWVDVAQESCVGWRPGSKKPGYWLCSAPARALAPLGDGMAMTEEDG